MSLKTRIPLLQSNPHLINSLGKKFATSVTIQRSPISGDGQIHSTDKFIPKFIHKISLQMKAVFLNATIRQNNVEVVPKEI